jgi:hypothetical protein
MKDIRIFRGERYRSEDVSIQKSIAPTQKADIALQLAIHWGMVAGMPDGEDTAGHSRMRRMTPDEITAHACDTAAAMWAEFEKRDWLLDVPIPRTEEELKAEKLASGK